MVPELFKVPEFKFRFSIPKEAEVVKEAKDLSKVNVFSDEPPPNATEAGSVPEPLTTKVEELFEIRLPAALL